MKLLPLLLGTYLVDFASAWVVQIWLDCYKFSWVQVEQYQSC
jgi:hypothetical protein